MIYYYFSGSALDNHFYHPIFSLFPYTHTHTHTHTSPHKLHIIEFSLTLHLDWIFKFLNKKTYDKKLGKSTTWTSHPLPSSIRLVNAVEWSLIIWSQYSETHKNLKRLIEQCQPRNSHKKVQRVNNVWEPRTMSAWALNKHHFSFWLPMNLEVSHQPKREARNDQPAPSFV